MLGEIRRAVPELAVSATGGVYTGSDAFAYIRAGAENIQLLSFLMGKVRSGLLIEGDKFRQVFHKLMFDEREGLLACMVRAGVSRGAA